MRGRINDVYNVSSNKEMQNIEVIGEVCDVLRKDKNELIEFVPDRPGHDFRYSVSNNKLVNLGFDKFTNFKDALVDTIDYYLEKGKT